MGTPTLVCVWSCPNFSAPAGRPFRYLVIWFLLYLQPCRSAVFAALQVCSIVNDSLGVTRMLIVIVQILDVYPSSTPKFLAADN
ncbi:hypothetical protein Tco_0513802 [Tanacetum coccineum]